MLKLRPLRGFTLIEMMIVIAILAVLASLAVPSFRAIIANTKIRATGQAILDGMQLARGEAIRLNERVQFVLAADSGWSVTTNSGTTLQTRSAGDGSDGISITVTPANATKVTFNPLGRIVNNADASAPLTRIDIDISTTIIPAAQSNELRIIATSGGLVRLCDPNVGSGDPRSC
jgi:type IV fimbrial biogenesis protein FimT